MNFTDCIREICNELLHPTPYLVCICGHFRRGEYDYLRYRTRCRNCGGWLKDYEVYDLIQRRL